MKHNETNQFVEVAAGIRATRITPATLAAMEADKRPEKPAVETESDRVVGIVLAVGIGIGLLVASFFAWAVYGRFDRADVNRDGKVTLTDLVLVQQAILAVTPEVAP